MRVPRTRGATSGMLLIGLGVWGALIPFVGPYFGYAIGPDDAWHWTAGRFWLSVLPGIVAIVAGLIMVAGAHRPNLSLGALLGIAAGTWFVCGQTVSTLWNDGVSQAGVAHGSTFVKAIAELGWFFALGALILYLASVALGRIMVRSVRDAEYARATAGDRSRHRRDAPLPPEDPDRDVVVTDRRAGTRDATTEPAAEQPTTGRRPAR